MGSLKPVYDAAKAADEKVSAIMAEMIAAFECGTDEGKQKALDLRPALDAAKEEARQANDLYVSMRDAQAGSDEHARRFVPVGDVAQKAGAKEITRAEYEAMDYAERHTYLKNGGAIVDHLSE
jgi:hypothetical protein